MTRHFVTVALLWAALTAGGEALAFLNMFPTVGSKEAEDFDQIFRTLLFMGIPVFTFVIAVLAYAMLAFRSRTGDETGPNIRGTGMAPKIWLAVTSGLAVLTMIYPGLTGLANLQGDRNGYAWGTATPELTIQVRGARWYWAFVYPDGIQLALATDKQAELVLPVDTVIKFEINSDDVVHSFWISAFRMKIDAIPGRTTSMIVQPTEIGDYLQDDAYRVQCAELCGLDHSLMRFPVKVVSKADYAKWEASQPKQSGGK